MTAGESKKKPVKVVDGNDFAKVFLRYGLERLVEEGHYSVNELSSLDDDGEYTKRLLSDKAFRKRLEAVEGKK
ncbi:MAG: hypothetical protein FJY77_01500 [Candidatus Altiarchaeales archaeon]|nr:hypothetical protein [Candidatus Altiarchaeales archaeon]